MDKLTNAIVELALDTENAEKNYNLGLLYEEIGQTASAINYFYRASERSKNKELAYESLCKAAICYDRQSNRRLTVRRILQHALYVRPKRPEAYYLFSKLLEKENNYVDSYTYASIALQICDFDAAPLRSDVGYPGMYGLIFQKAIAGWHWGKNEETRNLLLELNTKYKDEMDTAHKTAVQNNLSNLKAGFNKGISSTTPKQTNKKVIIDCFSYYDPYSSELLELRVNLLKNYVDYFVVTELNKTHSGEPSEFKLKDRIKELNLPEDKIIVINLEVPDDDKLSILDIDYHNAGTNSNNMNSVRARARERMQKDALLLVLDRFDDDTFIIHSDCDEIIDPKSIEFVTNMARTAPKNIIKVPLVHLEGRADLRVHYVNGDAPKPWNLSMFVCTKRQLVMTNPTNIRSNYKNPFPIVWCTENNKIAEDLGWHFSWMGGSAARKIKKESFIHYDDAFDFLEFNGFNNDKAQEAIVNYSPEEGTTPPSLEKGTLLRKYNTKNLPSLIFELPRVKNFLFAGKEECKQDTIDDSTNAKVVSSLNWSTLPYADIVTIQREIGSEDVYGYWRKIKEGDVVVDIGASVGPFVCTNLKNKPSKVYCVEPSKVLSQALKENINKYNVNSTPIVYIEKAIIGEHDDPVNIFGGSYDFETTKFMQLIQDNNIDKINYLKIDCEGGEYSIFSDENIEYLVNNVEYVAMEVHLKYSNGRNNFKNFRDKYLSRFNNYKVVSCTMQSISYGNNVDLKNMIFDDNFVDTYNCEFMIYIWNEPK